MAELSSMSGIYTVPEEDTIPELKGSSRTHTIGKGAIPAKYSEVLMKGGADAEQDKNTRSGNECFH